MWSVFVKNCRGDSLTINVPEYPIKNPDLDVPDGVMTISTFTAALFGYVVPKDNRWKIIQNHVWNEWGYPSYSQKYVSYRIENGCTLNLLEDSENECWEDCVKESNMRGFWYQHSLGCLDFSNKNVAKRMLNVACTANNTEIAKMALNNGASVEYGASCYFVDIDPEETACKGNRDVYELLLENGLPVDHVGQGKTMLAWAIRVKDRKICELLLERGADMKRAIMHAIDD